MTNVEQMKDAYGLLFEIETGLRHFINHQMSIKYGTNWYKTAPQCGRYPHEFLRKPYFHELEGYFHRYPCFSIPRSFITSLRKLYPIRNQIAHCNNLTQTQYIQLYEIHKTLKAVLDEQTANNGEQVLYRVNH